MPDHITESSVTDARGTGMSISHLWCVALPALDPALWAPDGSGYHAQSEAYPDAYMESPESAESPGARVQRIASDARRRLQRAEKSRRLSEELLGEADALITSHERGVTQEYDARAGDLARDLRRVHGRRLKQR